MKSTEKVIELIDKGDPVAILAEATLVDNFNELLKYELIDIINEKVILTKKGKKVRDLGFDKVIAELKIQEELKDFSEEIQKKESKLIKICFGLCMSLLAIFLIVSLFNYSLNF